MDSETIIWMVVTGLTAIGLGVTIPQALVNRIQKALTVMDNLLIRMAAKDAHQKQMADGLRARIDSIYTMIADGKITIMEAYQTMKDLHACYDIIKAYEPEKKLLDKIAELKAQMEAVSKELAAVQVTVDSPAAPKV
jgi:hypothetical protein